MLTPRQLTDVEFYRLFVCGDWDLIYISPESQSRLHQILKKAQTDPQLAAELDQIDRELAAAQEGWVTSLLEAAPEDSLGFQDCL
jgi:hypothetical protein